MTASKETSLAKVPNSSSERHSDFESNHVRAMFSYAGRTLLVQIRHGKAEVGM